MIISAIKLVNWKNFQHVDVKLSSRVFVVGANASGKSNFLDVIRFMRDIVKQAGGLQFAVEQRGGVSKIRCLAARKRSDVAIEMSLSEDEFFSLVGLPKENSTPLLCVVCWHSSTGKTPARE